MGVSSGLRLIIRNLGWFQIVLDDFGQFRMISGGFGWFRVVCCFGSYLLLETKQVRSPKIYFDIFIEIMFGFLLHLLIENFKQDSYGFE